MRETLKMMKAAGEENRVRILNMLSARSLCVCEIAEVLQLAQSTVSRHLRLLEDTGFLTRSKEGLWVNYQLIEPVPGSVQDHLLALIRVHFSGPLKDDLVAARTVNREQICGV